MNKKFKFLTVLLALVMTLSAFAPFSARAEEAKETKTVTLHKILMTKSNLNSENARKVTVEYTNKDGKAESKEFVIIKKDENNYELAAQSKVEKDKIANTDATINEKLKNENLNVLYNGQDAKEVFEGHIGLDGTSYNGNAIDQITQYFGDTAKEISGVYFKIQKLKAGIEAEKADAKNDEQWEDFTIEQNGEVISDPSKEGLTKENGWEINTTGLKGKFRIIEIHDKSTYKGKEGETLTGSKAVPTLITLPLVNEKGVVEHAHVYPKNIEDKPQIDKNFVKGHGLEIETDDEGNNDAGADYANYLKKKATAKAQVGKVVPYEVKTLLPKDAKYKTATWNDSMTNGLTFNKDLKILGLDGFVEGKDNDYILEQDDRGFKLTLTEAGLKKLEAELENSSKEVILVYSATVNSDSVVDEPEKNHIEFEYNNQPTEPTPEPPETKPLKNQISVTKTWSEGQAPASVVVVYTLQEKDGDNWKDVKSVTITKPDYSYTFTGLDDKKTYHVKERVSGYTPEYKAETGKYNVTNKKHEGPTPLKPTTPEVVNGGKKFVKTNQDGNERLAGAEFYIRNANSDDALYLIEISEDEKANRKTDYNAKRDALYKAVEEYNLMTKEQQDGDEGKAKKAEIEELQKQFTAAAKKYSQKYTWGTEKEGKVVVLTSNEQGQFEIKGLAYGTYYLKEKTAPKDYALREDFIEFEVKEGSYGKNSGNIDYVKESKENDALCVTNKKVTIPQTGGIGTVIFTVVGVMLMVGAAFALKRRKEDELEGLA